MDEHATLGTGKYAKPYFFKMTGTELSRITNVRLQKHFIILVIAEKPGGAALALSQNKPPNAFADKGFGRPEFLISF